MKYYQGKKKWRSILESWPVLLVLIILIFLFAYGIFGFLGKVQDTAKNRTNAESAVLELRDRESKLSSDLEFLDTVEGQEKVFRENFGLAKEGEGVIIVVDDEEKSVEKEKKGFLGFIKNWFK